MSAWARERRLDAVLAGLAAGIVEGTVCNTPMETIQTKLMQDQLSNKRQYQGIFRPIVTIAQQQGFKVSCCISRIDFALSFFQLSDRNTVVQGLYQGLAPLLIKVGSNHAVRFSVFDILRENVAAWNSQQQSRSTAAISPDRLMASGSDGGDLLPKPAAAAAATLSAWQTWVCGAMAGGMSVVANHPFDVCKTNMMSAHRGRYRNWVHCAQVLVKEGGGARALFVGFWPRFLRVCSEMGFVFLFYERISTVIDEHLP